MSDLKTSLYDKHTELGAKMVDFAGWLMPIQYKNLKEEVVAVREKSGVFDVSHMGEFFIQGPDAIKFTDYLVTNDIANAQNGKAIYSPLCREDGTIIDDLIVYKLEDEKIMICVNAANIEKDFNWMKSKISNFNCEISNESQNYSLIALQGPDSFRELQNIDLGFQINDTEYYSIQNGNDDKSFPTLIARTGYTGEDGFEIFTTHDKINSIWTQLIENGVQPCGLGSRDVLRLEVCFPLYGNELNDQVTPLDSGLKWTVKFKKDHFIGKEFLESYQPEYRIIKLVLEKGIPRPHYPILIEDQPVGEVTSGTMSVIHKKGIALARVKKEFYSDDANFNIEIRGKKYKAEVVKKPFVSGGHK